ncbi:transposase domain-containing protein [Streptacidiphilus sp. N1-10]|uniref:Transposase domain-containing protein n=1 Tax=Streptacidiphilus jeojiensis TaxID=3229225 RepID=A0ABV6XHW3_9ACTN
MNAPGCGGLPDRIAIGLLTWAFPAEQVDRVLAETGRTQERTRLLPARVVVYFVLALCLFPGLKYERVAELLSQGLIWGLGRPTRCPVPTAAALSRARARLGPEPLRALFAERAAAVAASAAPQGTAVEGYRGLRVLVLDAARFEVPDSEENTERFPDGGTDGDPDRFLVPRVQVMALADQRSRTVVDARLGAGRDNPVTLARRLLRTVGAGELLLADFGSVRVRPWCIAREGGAELLWSVPATAQLSRHATLPDGSFRSVLDGAGECGEGEAALAVPVRVLDCVVDGEPLRLVTSLLDPAAAPAAELVALFAERWRFRDALTELTGGGRAVVPVLRARSARGVEQEVWGLLLVHQALGALLRPGTAAPAALPAAAVPAPERTGRVSVRQIG